MRDPTPGNNTPEQAMRDELDDLHQKIARLNNRLTATVPQMRESDVDDPQEGQDIIDWDDNHTRKWYSDGAWRSSSAGSAVVPYPQAMPHAAVMPSRAETRYWPGGMVVIPAYQYATGGTVGANFSGEMAYKEVTHSQVAANFAAANETLNLDIDAIGIPLGYRYQVWIGARLEGTATGAVIKISPKPVVNGTPHATDAGYPTFGFASATTYFGLERPPYSVAAGGGGGNEYEFSAGDTLSVKAYQTSGSGIIHIDAIYFIPVRYQPGSPSVFSTYYSNPGGNAYRGATCAFATLPTYEPVYNSGNILKDTQVREGERDAALTYSMQAYAYTDSYHDPVYLWEMDHPRHAYALCRMNATATEYINAGGFVHFTGGFRTGFGVVNHNSWHFVYLGLLPANVYPGAGENATAMFIAADSGPYHEAYGTITDIRISEMLWISSIYDWQSARNGVFAHL